MTMTEQDLRDLVAKQNTPGRDTFDGGNYYGPDANYLIYSVGVDRFILSDKYDLWTTLENAKLLSSKIPLTLIALTNCSIDINNENCLFYTVSEKTGWKMSENACPELGAVSGNDAVEEAGIALDFKDPISAKWLVNLQNYAFFQQKVLHAIRIADAETNSDDAVFFKELMDQGIATLLQSRADHTRTPQGALLWTKRVLYTSNSIEEAIAGINKIWDSRVLRDKDIREKFFKYSGLTFNPGDN